MAHWQPTRSSGKGPFAGGGGSRWNSYYGILNHSATGRHSPYYRYRHTSSSPPPPPPLRHNMPRTKPQVPTDIYQIPAILDDLADRDPPQLQRAMHSEELKALVLQGKIGTFDVKQNKYVAWERNGLSMRDLKARYEHGTLKAPPVDRPAGDPNTECTGYMVSGTHACLAIPIPSLRARKKGKFAAEADSGDEVDQDQDEVEERDEVELEKGIRQSLDPDQQVHSGRADLQDSASIASGSGSQTTTPRPLPRPSLGAASSFYTDNVASKRRQTDEALITSVIDAAAEGIYNDNPLLHPLNDYEAWPAALKTFTHLTGYTTRSLAMRNRRSLLTKTLHLFNSKEGLESDVFATLRAHTVHCLSCCCYFSPDGYGQHLSQDSRCQGTPALEIVPDLSAVLQSLPLQSLPDIPGVDSSGYVYPETPAIDLAVGQAWQRWHSRAGITHDAWVMISTGFRRCPVCSKCRSYDGHRSHMDAAGACGDVGDDDMQIPPRAERVGSLADEAAERWYAMN
ncbi:hypothetical protein D9758_009755 [Tetrapyrgos nigripes]|uniref:Uncharacterized protein n=1 Tax=Tetrapyrgos nigripes TaxID=182062 RepID=A0A8H5GJS1_9AGAR|nr:hypothetical protein D9758_009755 [Tetrapyrgos nigripes]